MSVILYSGWYSEEVLRAHPDITFVFGDNLLGYGKGGQAIIRDEPNAFGIPTKRKPAMSNGSFFSEHSETDLDSVLDKIEQLWNKLKAGETILIPVTGDGDVSLGLERAMLKEKAPTIYKAITTHVKEMCAGYGFQEVSSEEGLDPPPS